MSDEERESVASGRAMASASGVLLFDNRIAVLSVDSTVAAFFVSLADDRSSAAGRGCIGALEGGPLPGTELWQVWHIKLGTIIGKRWPVFIALQAWGGFLPPDTLRGLRLSPFGTPHSAGFVDRFRPPLARAEEERGGASVRSSAGTSGDQVLSDSARGGPAATRPLWVCRDAAAQEEAPGALPADPSPAQLAQWYQVQRRVDALNGVEHASWPVAATRSVWTGHSFSGQEEAPEAHSADLSPAQLALGDVGQRRLNALRGIDHEDDWLSRRAEGQDAFRNARGGEESVVVVDVSELDVFEPDEFFRGVEETDGSVGGDDVSVDVIAATEDDVRDIDDFEDSVGGDDVSVDVIAAAEDDFRDIDDFEDSGDEDDRAVIARSELVGDHRAAGNLAELDGVARVDEHVAGRESAAQGTEVGTGGGPETAGNLSAVSSVDAAAVIDVGDGVERESAAQGTEAGTGDGFRTAGDLSAVSSVDAAAVMDVDGVERGSAAQGTAVGAILVAAPGPPSWQVVGTSQGEHASETLAKRKGDGVDEKVLKIKVPKGSPGSHTCALCQKSGASKEFACCGRTVHLKCVCDESNQAAPTRDTEVFLLCRGCVGIGSFWLRKVDAKVCKKCGCPNGREELVCRKCTYTASEPRVDLVGRCWYCEKVKPGLACQVCKGQRIHVECAHMYLQQANPKKQMYMVCSSCSVGPGLSVYGAGMILRDVASHAVCRKCSFPFKVASGIGCQVCQPFVRGPGVLLRSPSRDSDSHSDDEEIPSPVAESRRERLGKALVASLQAIAGGQLAPDMSVHLEAGDAGYPLGFITMHSSTEVSVLDVVVSAVLVQLQMTSVTYGFTARGHTTRKHVSGTAAHMSGTLAQFGTAVVVHFAGSGLRGGGRTEARRGQASAQNQVGATRVTRSGKEFATVTTPPPPKAKATAATATIRKTTVVAARKDGTVQAQGTEQTQETAQKNKKSKKKGKRGQKPPAVPQVVADDGAAAAVAQTLFGPNQNATGVPSVAATATQDPASLVATAPGLANDDGEDVAYLGDRRNVRRDEWPCGVCGMSNWIDRFYCRGCKGKRPAGALAQCQTVFHGAGGSSTATSGVAFTAVERGQGYGGGGYIQAAPSRIPGRAAVSDPQVLSPFSVRDQAKLSIFLRQNPHFLDRQVADTDTVWSPEVEGSLVPDWEVAQRNQAMLDAGVVLGRNGVLSMDNTVVRVSRTGPTDESNVKGIALMLRSMAPDRLDDFVSNGIHADAGKIFAMLQLARVTPHRLDVLRGTATGGVSFDRVQYAPLFRVSRTDSGEQGYGNLLAFLHGRLPTSNVLDLFSTLSDTNRISDFSSLSLALYDLADVFSFLFGEQPGYTWRGALLPLFRRLGAQDVRRFPIGFLKEAVENVIRLWVGVMTTPLKVRGRIVSARPGYTACAVLAQECGAIDISPSALSIYTTADERERPAGKGHSASSSNRDKPTRPTSLCVASLLSTLRLPPLERALCAGHACTRTHVSLDACKQDPAAILERVRECTFQPFEDRKGSVRAAISALQGPPRTP